MAKYMKKPIEIEAVLYSPGLEDGFIKVYDEDLGHIEKPYIDTLEGKLTFNEDDYIITGVRGERYAVRRDIFEETYVEVTDCV